MSPAVAEWRLGPCWEQRRATLGRGARGAGCGARRRSGLLLLQGGAMAGPALRSAPVRLLFLLALLELSPAGSLAPGSPLRPPENRIDPPGPALWTPQTSHHRRRGAGVPGAVATASRPASWLPGQSPAGPRDGDLLPGLALPYTEKEHRVPGWARARRRGRERKRRRDRARLHRGGWRGEVRDGAGICTAPGGGICGVGAWGGGLAKARGVWEGRRRRRQGRRGLPRSPRGGLTRGSSSQEVLPPV